MKALSLRQPWAWLVSTGLKPVENRVWHTNVRGNFLIHAAKGMTKDEYDDAIDFVRETVAHFKLPAIEVPAFDVLERGGIVGRARIVDVLPPCKTENPSFYAPCAHAWHMQGQYGFRLADAHPLPFTPCSGLQRWFTPPLVVLRALGLLPEGRHV